MYKTLKQVGRKTLAVGGLVGLLGVGLVGCKDSGKTEIKKELYEFKDFGYFKTHKPFSTEQSFAVADMDGDGDLDIVAFNDYYDLIEIYENKIPQKDQPTTSTIKAEVEKMIEY